MKTFKLKLFIGICEKFIKIGEQPFNQCAILLLNIQYAVKMIILVAQTKNLNKTIKQNKRCA